jgi:hypothetical protein
MCKFYVLPVLSEFDGNISGALEYLVHILLIILLLYTKFQFQIHYVLTIIKDRTF